METPEKIDLDDFVDRDDLTVVEFVRLVETSHRVKDRTRRFYFFALVIAFVLVSSMALIVFMPDKETNSWAKGIFFSALAAALAYGQGERREKEE